MFIATLISICVLCSLAAGELSAGIYRIQNRYYFKSLAAQFGNAIQTVGGIPSDDVRVTWFVAPAPGHAHDAYIIQNVHSLQYLSVSGAPMNGSILVPSDAPFVWTYTAQGELGVGNLSVATITFQTLVLLPHGTDNSQQWNIAGVQPFGATYRLWHPRTNTYLTGPSAVPGRVMATHVDPDNALQYWTLNGTSVSSRTGTLTSVGTRGFLGITNNTVAVGTSSASSAWLFEIVRGGGASQLASGGQALAVTPHRRVVAEPPDEHSEAQVFVFVPAAPPTD